MVIENEDALPELSLIDSTPEEAAENIKIAKNMQTTPSIVKEIKPQLSKITGGRFAASTQVTPEVKRSLGKSPEHASLMKNDIDKMSLLERHWNYAVETIRGVDRRRQLADYAIREILGEKLPPKDLYAKRKLQFEQEQIEETRQLFDMNLVESTPAEIAGVVFDVSRAAIENWKSLGLGIGVGGLLGGALGFAVGGPPGALVLGRMGATRAGGLAATLVFAADTFKQTAASVWNELENISAGVNRNGQLMSVPLPEDERRAIATGVGVLSAIVGTFGGRFVASRIPFLQKFTDPKGLAKFIASPEGSTLRGLAKRVAAAGIVEGSTEGFQEFLEIMGKNLGSTWDGSETKFTEALNNTLGTWERAKETATQVGKASFLGAVAAGTFTSAGMAVSPRVRVDEKQVVDDPEVDTELPPEPRLFENGGKPRSEFSDIVNPNLPSSVKGTQAVQLQIALLRMKEIADATETKKLSPDELNDLQKRIFESSGFTSVYIDKDELQTWTTDEQKAAKARSILDPTGIAAAQANARIRVDINKFMQLVDEDPSIAEIARPTADGMSAREYLALVQEQRQKAAEILKSIPETEREAAFRDMNVAIRQLEITQENRKRALSEAQRLLKELGDNATPEQIITIEGDIQMLQNAIAKTDRHIEELRSGQVRIRDEDIFGEEAYLEQPTFTETTAEMFTEKEREKYNAAQREARQAVVKAINDAAEKDMNQRRDLFLTMRLFQERVDLIEAYQNNPHIDVVENFLNNTAIIGELTPEQQSRLARGLPVLAIDPKTLPPGLEKYTKNRVLKKRNVFDDKGVHINDAMAALGVNDPVELLDILSTVPTRERAIAVALREKRKIFEAEVTEQIDLDEALIAKEYNKAARNHQIETKVLISKKWPIFRKSIEKAALWTPKRNSEIAVRARSIVRATRVRDLDVNAWKIGERKSQRKAVQAATRNQAELFHREKENAVLSLYAAKETHIAIGQVNRATKFIALLNTKDMRQMLKDAGDLYLNAVDAILDVFNFDPSKKNQADIENYRKYAEKMLKDGQGDFRIPDEVLEWANDKVNAQELTVDQYLYLANKLRAIVKQAEFKNELLSNYWQKQQIQTIETLREAVDQTARQHPDYDEKRADAPPTSLTGIDFVDTILKGPLDFLSNIQSQVIQLNKGVIGDFFSQLIWHPLMGIGQHKGDFGILALRAMEAIVSKRIADGIKKYDKAGGIKFADLHNTTVFVEEFRNISSLNYGHLTRANLMTLLMNMGNAGNIARIRNFGVSPELMMNVLQKHLEKKDFDFVQEVIWDTFETFKPKLAALERMTNNAEIEFTQPVAFEAFGTEYRGGYFPIRYDQESFAKMVKEGEKAYEMTKSSRVITEPNDVWEGIVWSPHTEARTHSNLTLDISPDVWFRGMSETMYDLTMRVPVRDVMKLLTDKEIARSITNIIGKNSYRMLLNHVMDMTNSPSATNIGFWAQTFRQIDKAMGSVQGAFAATVLVLNPKTIAVQFASVLTTTLLKMGPSGVKHLANAVIKLNAPWNWRYRRYMREFFAEIDPQSAAIREKLDAGRVEQFGRFIPVKRKFKGKIWNKFRKIQEAVNNFGFETILNEVELQMREHVITAAYNQFMAGDAPGWSIERVAAMSKEDRYKQATAYASEIVSSTLFAGSKIDRSALQKTPIAGKLFATFWNDARNHLNANIQEVRNIRYDLRAAVEKAKAGDDLGAYMSFHDARSRMLKMFILSTLGVAFFSMVYGRRDEETGEEFTFERLPEYYIRKLSTPEGILSVGGEVLTHTFGQNIPLVRDALYAFDSFSERKTVTAPFYSVLSNATTAASSTVQLMSDTRDTLNLLTAWERLSDQQRRSLFMTGGVLLGGLPVNAFYNWTEIVNNLYEGKGAAATTLGLGAAAILPMLKEETTQSIDAYIEEVETPAERYERQKAAMRAEGNQPKEERSALIDLLREMRDQINPFKSKGEPISEDSYLAIMYAESGGVWNASPGTSSAFGLFQFTKDTWDRIVAQAPPELGLRGKWKSRDVTYQWRAMRWLTRHNARILRSQGVPVNEESIYFAHHFGTKHARLLNLPDKTRLPSDFLTPGVLGANPWLSRRGVKTVGDLKAYLRSRLQDGHKQLKRNREAGTAPEPIPLTMP